MVHGDFKTLEWKEVEIENHEVKSKASIIDRKETALRHKDSFITF